MGPEAPNASDERPSNAATRQGIGMGAPPRGSGAETGRDKSQCVEIENERPAVVCLPTVGWISHCDLMLAPISGEESGSDGIAAFTVASPATLVVVKTLRANGNARIGQAPKFGPVQVASTPIRRIAAALGSAPDSVMPNAGFGVVLRPPFQPMVGTLPTVAQPS